jgi:predicted acylesterase/phospholipase RssA
MKKVEHYFAMFEGGGAKGIAYAGAIYEAEKRGIRFEGACGVSVGAIAATFVAAGLSKEKILALLLLPISDILNSGTKGRFDRLKENLLLWFTLEGYRSSEGIAFWMEKVLRQELCINRPVIFKDLPKPLALLAYDSANGEPQIWSTLLTPNEQVATAVRASCSIPGLFSSVKSGLSSFRDGGILDNTPTFLVEMLNRHTELPTLAFRLYSSDTVISKNSSKPGRFGRLLDKIGVALDARTRVGGKSDFTIREIKIDCGNVRTADFYLPKRARLRLAIQGAKAIKQSFRKPDMSTGASAVDEILRDENLRQSKVRHAALIRTGELIDQAVNTIRIFAGDISWLEELAPYLLAAAANRRICIQLITRNATAEKIYWAKHLGINVGVVCDEVDLRMSMIDGQNEAGCLLIVEKENPESPLFFSKFDSPHLLRHFNSYFNKVWIDASITERVMPSLKLLTQDDVISALRHVPQYRNSRMSVVRLKANSVLPSCGYVETFKLERLKRVEKIYEGHQSTAGYWIRETPWYSMLPIVEKRPEGTLVVIDGAHRFYNAYLTDGELACILVECDAELPSSPVSSWQRVRLTTAKLERNVRYENFKSIRFRPIKSTVSGRLRETDSSS